MLIYGEPAGQISFARKPTVSEVDRHANMAAGLNVGIFSSSDAQVTGTNGNHSVIVDNRRKAQGGDRFLGESLEEWVLDNEFLKYAVP